jgi:hypothetical protein
MADSDATTRYSAAVANIADTTKWILATLGAVFAVLLGGVQLNGLGFAHPERVPLIVWVAVVVAFFVVMVALYLAITILVSDGVTLNQLVTERRYRKAREYLNHEWRSYYPDATDPLGNLYLQYKAFLLEIRSGTRRSDDPDYLTSITRLQDAVSAASWRMALVRFGRLKLALLCLVPAALLSALALVSQSGTLKDNQGAVAIPIALDLKLDSDDRALFRKKGWPAACASSDLLMLVYAETSTGVADAATFPSAGCPARHLLLLDRKTILKVFDPS